VPQVGGVVGSASADGDDRGPPLSPTIPRTRATRRPLRAAVGGRPPRRHPPVRCSQL